VFLSVNDLWVSQDWYEKQKSRNKNFATLKIGKTGCRKAGTKILWVIQDSQEWMGEKQERKQTADNVKRSLEVGES
jgi:hypothetical protein